jgi:chemosensory pili system protein ChpC
MANENIRSLLIPLSKGNLLLPSVTIAEVLPYSLPHKAQGPAWLVGTLDWRDQTVPVVRLETIANIDISDDKTTHRIVIFYGLENIQHFYAIITQNIPRTLIVNKNLLTEAKATDMKGFAASVKVDGQQAWLPDYEYLEELFESIK